MMLNEILPIKYPIIMAPMFLVTNVKMMLAAMDSGIAGCIPALNFRTLAEFEKALIILQKTGKCYGVNLIVNKSNYKLQDQLNLCLQYKVPFIITSLGSPEKVISACRSAGIKVFCDVSEMAFAHKAARFAPDALIAVLNNAGGHHGHLSAEQFIPALRTAFPSIPVISAGGVGDHKSYINKLNLGVSGVSIGSVFIASEESDVTAEYKEACVHYGAADIVSTTKLSGVPCTVINTPYVRDMGLRENWLERFLHRNKRFKKWLKMIVYKRGMSLLQKAAFSASYQKVWCAGPTIESTTEILPIQEIVRRLVQNID